MPGQEKMILEYFLLIFVQECLFHCCCWNIKRELQIGLCVDANTLAIHKFEEVLNI